MNPSGTFGGDPDVGWIAIAAQHSRRSAFAGARRSECVSRQVEVSDIPGRQSLTSWQAPDWPDPHPPSDGSRASRRAHHCNL